MNLKTIINRIFFVLLLIALVVITWMYYLEKQDGYHLVEYSISPDGQFVGVIITNMGGGGPGYCRDLVYKFPKHDFLPDFSKEKRNKVFLIRELGCGEAKKIHWAAGKLKID